MSLRKNLGWLILAALSGAAANTLATSISPVFPEYASENCIEGYVEFSFVVSETGNPEQIRIIYSEPENVFEEATLKNISRWTFDEAPGTFKEMVIEYRIEDCEPSDS